MNIKFSFAISGSSSSSLLRLAKLDVIAVSLYATKAAFKEQVGYSGTLKRPFEIPTKLLRVSVA